MKEKLLTILTVMLIGVLLVMLQSCKEDPEPGEPELLTKKISRTWNLHRATVDEIDVTNSFKNMAITFRTDHTFNVTNGVSPIWPASGSFEIVQGNDGLYGIKRGDGVLIDVISLDESSVVLELLYTSDAGRVSGNYRFEMNQ